MWVLTVLFNPRQASFAFSGLVFIEHIMLVKRFLITYEELSRLSNA